MKLNVKVAREGSGKVWNRTDPINIDLYNKKEALLARLIFKEDSEKPGNYILGEDFFFRSKRLEIQVYGRQE